MLGLNVGIQNTNIICNEYNMEEEEAIDSMTDRQEVKYLQTCKTKLFHT